MVASGQGFDLAARIWKRQVPLEEFTARHAQTLPGLLGIQLGEIGPDFARATMPVDSRHIQPFGILHGGCSVVLAETLGSYCSLMCVEPGKACVGIEINASHLAAVRVGDLVEAVCRPIRIGRTLHVWQIDLCRSDGVLSCVARLTTTIQDRRDG
jgi:1,4-dihydroxy-2-naphthoyl-CoA hydrolase